MKNFFKITIPYKIGTEIYYFDEKEKNPSVNKTIIDLIEVVISKDNKQNQNIEIRYYPKDNIKYLNFGFFTKNDIGKFISFNKEDIIKNLKKIILKEIKILEERLKKEKKTIEEQFKYKTRQFLQEKADLEKLLEKIKKIKS